MAKNNLNKLFIDFCLQYCEFLVMTEIIDTIEIVITNELITIKNISKAMTEQNVSKLLMSIHTPELLYIFISSRNG